jgi:transposase
MSKARLVITAVVVEGRSQAEVARAYGVSKGWVSKLVARYRAEGESAFEPRSRRPKTNPNASPPEVIDRIVAVRRKLVRAGLDAGPETIAWHLWRTDRVRVAPATISRQLSKLGWSPRHHTNAQSLPTSGSKPSCRTRPGSPTSPTTHSLTAPEPRSCLGLMTAPVTRCGSPRTSGSPDRSCSPASVLVLLAMASRPQP